MSFCRFEQRPSKSLPDEGAPHLSPEQLTKLHKQFQETGDILLGSLTGAAVLKVSDLYLVFAPDDADKELVVLERYGAHAGPLLKAPRHVWDGLRFAMEQDVKNLIQQVLGLVPNRQSPDLFSFLSVIGPRRGRGFLGILLSINLFDPIQIHGKEAAPIALLDKLGMERKRAPSFYQDILSELNLKPRDQVSNYALLGSGIESLFKSGRTVDAAILPLPQTSHIYAVKDSLARQSYFIFPNTGVYFPKSNVFLYLWKVRDSIAKDWIKWMARLLSELVPVNKTYRDWISDQDKQPCLVLGGGVLHIGHAIWDEFQGLDRIYETYGADCGVGVAISADLSAVDVFGPIEEIYPELRGRVTRVSQTEELLKECVSNRLAPLPVSGRHIRAGSRERLARHAQQTAEQLGCDYSANGVRLTPGAFRLAFGLRLFNRTPDNLMNVYLEIARRLAAQVPELVVIFDGLNGSSAEGPVISKANSQPRIEGQDNGTKVELGNEHLSQEMGFVEAFCDLHGVKNLQVVSCIGTSPLENLAWLSTVNYFVAPYGAGLAKLRWALDKPGFALTGERNLRGLDLLKIYNDSKYMDGKFTSLKFTSLSEVSPVLGDSLLALPSKPVSIPFPDNFHVDVERVTKRILRHIRAAC
ncbi:hypothetical protein [Celeribacter neptunius]|uniref:Uncharacterized protein n=1 Tax=Celeribacter neptunius TaxID=588602 RepID=A0A1I3YCH1_9RHOB|nr:hypothetical protein [Celeribacter neptunius]SFK29512.1 hypothetical protein SAMN04487991_4315 [Celeribacter neptunius]